MASFSRGLLQHSLRPLSSPRVLLSELSAPRTRLFTTSFRWQAASSPAKATKLPTSRPPQKAPSPKSSGPTSYALIKSLATKPTPTVLYEGASHFWFYFGCWTSGLTILSWTCLTGRQVILQPEGVPEFVSWVYGASYVLLAAMGFYLISKTPNIVSSIRVLPAAKAAASASVAAVKAPGAQRAGSTAAAPLGLTMEVTVQRMLPFLQPKVLTVPLEKVSLKSRFSLPEEYVPELKRRELARQVEEQKAKLRKFDMEHLLTMPFRRLGRAFVSMFTGVRAAWTDMGFGVINVDGKDYKVNVEKGFAHDGFRTLERIVPINPK